MNIFVGTYTDLGGPGIWFGSLDGDALTHRYSKKDADNPNYLILSKDKSALFAVCGNGRDGFFVLSYALSGGEAALISKQPVSGRDPCHLALSGDEKYLVTANYSDGSVSVFPVDGNMILPECEYVRHSGKSVNPARQEAPHAHHVSFAPDDPGLLWVADLGIDKIVGHRFDPAGGKLTPAGAIGIEPGSGPRHVAYLNNGRWMYVCEEMSNEVTFIERSGAEGTARETHSTLPDGYADTSYCAAIRVSKDGRFVYVSNRGHDSIAVFSVGSSGGLTFDRHVPSGGKNPRDFVVFEDGRILTANQDAGGLVLLDGNGNVISRADVPGAVAIAY